MSSSITTSAEIIDSDVQATTATTTSPAVPSDDSGSLLQLRTTRPLALAIWALRFAFFADAIHTQVLGPIYALLVSQDGNPELFEITEPFDFAAAYCFLPMTADIGMVISSLLFRHPSDKIGRKPCIVACMLVGADYLLLYRLLI